MSIAGRQLSGSSASQIPAATPTECGRGPVDGEDQPRCEADDR
jgi:hypothetical protein